MNINELRSKTKMTRLDERLTVQDTSLDPEVILDFITGFGVRYFSKLGLDVQAVKIDGDQASMMYSVKEVRFNISLKDFNIGYISSILAVERNQGGDIKNMQVIFCSSSFGIGMAPELSDNFESSGNDALKKQFRKRLKKVGAGS